MNPLDDRDERQMEAFLAAARDAVPPDSTFLARLREQSTEVFQASSNSLPLRKRGRLMTARILRVLAASAAVLFILGPGVCWWLLERNAEPALARVLDNTAQANSLHCRIVREGESFDVWTEASGRLRRDNADGTYQIAAEGRLWRIDEKANRAASRPSPYHRDPSRHQLDMLALLELPVEPQRGTLAATRPSGETERDGVAYFIYHLEIPDEQTPLEIEALVDRRTQRLHSLEASQKDGGEAKPFARLNVLAYNEAVPEEKFVVRDTLTEDGRVGKVVDVQGVVGVKPVLHQRWSPVSAHLLLKPGDWLRTDLRGANAADVRLVKRTRVILGPGTLLVVSKPEQVRLIEGELEITVPADAKLELLGPDKKTVAVKGTQRFRVDRDSLVAVRTEPRWLKAFKGKTSDESIGSLIARVDGRNVPLTVGQHKVRVTIRDQIARTEIEESFVNHTDGVLEGVFHFPLPDGASVAGFGMWIGDKLVEADIVEKQRAREIYETILQEKRDPGLLEWTGGNIFKARVYPIFAHSEKRIKISYTQVLPFKNGSYRYNYALQSELLQLRPLRELSLDVQIHSAAPLKNVTCPTHTTRLDRTEHSAHVEFSAQEYSPTRDFEVVVEPDGKQADVLLIPHRRGNDGYFMMQLTPPAAAGDERALLPDGEPLHLLIVADTSASMDTRQRTVQANFIAALLSCLTPRDTVNLAACDVECDWVFEKVVPATPSNLVAARQFLLARQSLGWTDLDKAFASVLKQCTPNTHVIYVGDGIPTSGDADPGALIQRLRRLYEAAGKGGTFHAVAPGNSYEAGVLKAIAALGGGSLRAAGGEKTPSMVAFELLGEIAQPALRDLKVEFRGLRTARVYPESLPNLPAGSQHILLGRYLPEGRDQMGEVIVTGTRGGKPVRFSNTVALKDAESGNSFLPRLWARMHLDHLLEQGASPALRDEIIALSEEYQIITPYTSLLVLESDADRERFAVKRTFRMRDGEKFFSQGRDHANYELKQQQMKRAGAWRQGLHRRLLRQLATLGRDARWLGDGNNMPRLMRASSEPRFRQSNESTLGLGLGMPLDREGNQLGIFFGGMGSPVRGDFLGRKTEDETVLGDLADSLLAPMGTPPSDEVPRAGDEAEVDEKALRVEPAEYERAKMPEPALPSPPMFLPYNFAGQNTRFESDEVDEQVDFSQREIFRRELRGPAGDFGISPVSRIRSRSARQAQWLDTLFPKLAAPIKASQRPHAKWPAEARTLVRSLLRTVKLAKLPGGVEIVQQTDLFDVRWQELTGRSRGLALVSPSSWLTRSDGDNQATLVNWCDGRERGILSRPLQLGCIRTAAPDDLRTLPFDPGDYSLSPLDEGYRDYVPTLEPQKEGRTLLRLHGASGSASEVRFLIDTMRLVVVQIEYRSNGKTTGTMRFENFVEVGGCWWARRIEATDDQGRIVSRMTRTIKPLSADTLAKQVKNELAGKGAVLFLHLPGKTVAEAKRAIAANKGTFNDHFTLLCHFAGRQQWTRTLEQLRKCEALAAGKPGMRWLRCAVLQMSRRHEELRQRLLDEAKELAKTAPTDPAASEDLVLAEHLLRQASSILEANEMLALLDQLRPMYARQPVHRQSMKHWTHKRLYALQQAGQTDEALRLHKQLAGDWPHDFSIQQQYVQALANAADYSAACVWLKTLLDQKTRWLPSEEEAFRNTYAQFLEAQGRYAELADYLGDWLKRNPESSSPYAQYLSALVRTDRMGRADTLAIRWLREGQASGPLTPAVLARLHAAIEQGLGLGYNLNTGRIAEPWRKRLADAALVLARRNETLSAANSILASWQFQQNEEAPRVRQVLWGELLAGIDKLPLERIEYYLQWLQSATPEGWKQLGEGLHKRWSAENDVNHKHRLGRMLVSVLNHQGSAALLAFLHEQEQKGPTQFRTSYVRELFDTLLAQPWSAEHEDEAFALLQKLSGSEDASERLREQAAALYQLTDRMLAARQGAKAIEHPEKLTRIELRKKQAEILRQARADFAERLKTALDKQPGPLAAWLKVERLYLLTLLERDLPQVAADCWAILGAEPPKVQEVPPEEDTARQLDEVLRQRCLMTLMYLATRQGADSALADRLLKYLDRGIAGAEDSSRWKQLKYNLLLALDRPKELVKTLQEWASAGDADNHWSLSLAFVLAEQGRLAEAIKRAESVEAEDELGPPAYRALAGWYLAVNRREQAERANLAIYRSMDEWRIHHTLSSRIAPWQRSSGNVAITIDRDVLLMFAALLDKASSPQQHLELLQQFYQATHDFRLLTGLADVVVGHTAEKVYPLLGGMHTLLAEVGDEAAVDELSAYLIKVRRRAGTAVDRRALDLLECLIERRATELKDQPGPHTAAALAALQRAFKGEWLPGEPRLLADFLAGLGAIPQAALAKEQLRQLKELHNQSAKGSPDRLHLALRHADTLAAHGRTDEAIAVLQAGLSGHQEARGGVLPVSANDALARLVGFLESARHHDRGEKLLLDQLRHPLHEAQRFWLTRRLYQLYHNALSSDTSVSLGRGVELYRAVERKLRDELGTSNEDHRRQLIEQLLSVYGAANGRKLPGVRDDLRTFAFKTLPELLKKHPNTSQNITTSTARTLHDVLGPRDGIEFLLDRIEHEPVWLRFNNLDGWHQFSWMIGQWRDEAKKPGDLDQRLLPLVLAELRRDLDSRQQRNRIFYHRNSSYFWKEKEADFAKVAEEVLAKHPQSGPAALHIADYFYRGLSRGPRAIEILLAAHQGKLLDDAGQFQLVGYLHAQARYADSVPLLQPLVKRWPETLSYRLSLMEAYFHTGRQADLLALLKDTDGFFHKKDRWTVQVLAMLAKGCLDTKLYKQSVAYYEELIPLHQRTQPRRGVGDGVLAEYYGNLAKAYAGLGKTAEAVDAAGGSIVSWGPTHHNRAEAIAALKHVLREARDLDDYVAARDKETSASGQDSALIRKVLGQVYLEKGAPRKAIPQLQTSISLQSNDLETHRLLIDCFDKLGEKQKAILALLGGAESSRRDIKLYQDLGRRLEDRPKEAERAFTSIVEVMPQESEGHALLAEIRAQQNRWTEAATQWQQVARIRALEPTGLLKLADAQVHLRQWEQAEQTLRKVRARRWPPRFGDVARQVSELEERIRKERD